MKNSTLNRSMLSGENMALLAELKSQNEDLPSKKTNENTVNNLQSKQEELDFLWQNFKINSKDEKSPGIYVLTGFIAGALSMFLMTAMLSITTFANGDSSIPERKIVKKIHGSFGNIDNKQNKQTEKQLSAEEITVNTQSVINDNYRVKPGDSLEAISIKFYGQASPANTEKIQKANNLESPHSIYAGQELLIPLN